MRYPSIDALRTVAILVMVTVHFVENLAGKVLPISGFGAPLFAFLSGVSYYLWVQGQERKGVADAEIQKVSVRRGLFVLGVGFAFNILVWMPEDTFNWDVLTFIGFALLILNLCRTVPHSILVLIAVLSVLLAPVFRTIVDYNAYWENNYYEGDLTLADLVIGATVTGYFPIFPWIAYSLAGWVTAAEGWGRGRSLVPTAILGVGLLVLAAVLLLSRNLLPTWVGQRLLTGWTMFPSTIEYVTATIGLILVVFAAARRWLDAPHAGRVWHGFAETTQQLSQYSFSIYVLHHLAHLWPLWLIAVLSGQEPTVYWQNATSVPVALGLAAVFLTLCAVGLKLLGPRHRWSLESWMRWLCD